MNFKWDAKLKQEKLLTIYKKKASCNNSTGTGRKLCWHKQRNSSWTIYNRICIQSHFCISLFLYSWINLSWFGMRFVFMLRLTFRLHKLKYLFLFRSNLSWHNLCQHKLNTNNWRHETLSMTGKNWFIMIIKTFNTDKNILFFYFPLSLSSFWLLLQNSLLKNHYPTNEIYTD